MIADAFRRWKHARRIRAAEAEIAARSFTPAPHDLDAPLVVSLTSYGPRLAVVGKVIASLLRQTVRPDRVILWLEQGIKVPEGSLDDASMQFGKAHVKENPPHLIDHPLVGMDLPRPDRTGVLGDVIPAKREFFPGP